MSRVDPTGPRATVSHFLRQHPGEAPSVRGIHPSQRTHCAIPPSRPSQSGHVQRRNVERRSPGAVGGGNREVVNGEGFPVVRVLKMDGGDGHTAV